MPFRPLKSLVQTGNLSDVLAGNLTTTNNTSTAVLTYAPPANSVVFFTVTFVGRRTDASNTGDGAVATLTCAYKNVGGTVTQIGSDTVALPYASTSINASAASSAVASNVVQLKIAGVNGATINWQVASGFAIVSL